MCEIYIDFLVLAVAWPGLARPSWSLGSKTANESSLFLSLSVCHFGSQVNKEMNKFNHKHMIPENFGLSTKNGDLDHTSGWPE